MSARPLPKKKGIRDTFHYHLQNEGKIWELNLGVEGGESLGFQEPDSLRRDSGNREGDGNLWPTFQTPSFPWFVPATHSIRGGPILGERSPSGPDR